MVMQLAKSTGAKIIAMDLDDDKLGAAKRVVQIASYI
jgi:D-arabinose 1-dehydrogenase-like Zn-dependent alcohol dehydrogenase